MTLRINSAVSLHYYDETMELESHAQPIANN